jgi:hypothetical protein
VKKKDGEKVRVPDELMTQMRRIQASYLTKNQIAPSFGELIWEAWQKSGTHQNGSTEISSPPKSDNTMQFTHTPEIREWLDLVQRAVRITHVSWRAMLGSIRNQLRLVAEVADDEQAADSGMEAASSPGVGECKKAG